MVVVVDAGTVVGVVVAVVGTGVPVVIAVSVVVGRSSAAPEEQAVTIRTNAPTRYLADTVGCAIQPFTAPAVRPPMM
jgi:hypothetical protein